MSSVIAETLADLVTPHVKDIAEKTAAHAPDEAAFDQVMNDYLLQQKNVILLTTASIMAGLGQDVNAAITAADNALSNNFIPTILKTVTKAFAKKVVKEGGKKVVKEGVKKTYEKLLTKPKMDDHHIFPQQFRKFFSSRDIDIDKYTINLTKNMHLKSIHGKGNAGLPGRWNQQWKDFIEKRPDATAEDIYKFAGKMMDEYKVNHVPIQVYRK